MKTMGKITATMFMATVIGVASSATWAEGRTSSFGKTDSRLKANSPPDFDIIAVGNKYTSGPKGIYRYGSCSNGIKVVVKNWGAAYSISGNNDAGNINIKLTIKKGSKQVFTDTKYLSSLGSKQHQEITWDGSFFSSSGSYTIRADIWANTSNSSKKRYPETNTNNNWSSVSTTVNHAC